MSLTSRSAASLAIAVAATTLAAATTFGGCGSLFPGTTPNNPAGGSTGNNGAGGMTSGGAGGAAGSGMIVMKDPSNYPQNTAGGMFPYPQGHALPHCTFPAYDTDKVAAAYTAWKMKFFDGSRVVRPENNNDTASEGIAYGMLIGVYMNDKPMFDALWNYARTKLDGNGLMTWHWSATTTIIDQGGATDADQDMAWALSDGRQAVAHRRVPQPGDDVDREHLFSRGRSGVACSNRATTSAAPTRPIRRISRRRTIACLRA